MMVGARASRAARAVRLLMLLLGLVTTPSIGLEAMQRPHCAQHELAEQHNHQLAGSATVPRGHAPEAWIQRHDHGCPHCPASECARVSPCTGATANALVPSRTAGLILQGHRVALDLGRRRAHSAVSPPDTPPPQLIA